MKAKSAPYFYYRNICLSLLLDSKTRSLCLHSTQAPPASYKPPWYWLCRGLRCRDLGPPFPVSVHFQHRAPYAEPAVYQQGDISCGECQGSTCDIILLLMAHSVRGLLIPKQTTAQTAPLCVRVCVMSRPPSIESCDSDL